MKQEGLDDSMDSNALLHSADISPGSLKERTLLRSKQKNLKQQSQQRVKKSRIPPPKTYATTTNSSNNNNKKTIFELDLDNSMDNSSTNNSQRGNNNNYVPTNAPFTSPPPPPPPSISPPKLTIPTLSSPGSQSEDNNNNTPNGATAVRNNNNNNNNINIGINKTISSNSENEEMTQKEIGGTPATLQELVLFWEAIATANLPKLGSSVFGPGAGMLANATKQLKEKYLLPVLSGSKNLKLRDSLAGKRTQTVQPEYMTRIGLVTVKDPQKGWSLAVKYSWEVEMAP